MLANRLLALPVLLTSCALIGCGPSSAETDAMLQQYDEQKKLAAGWKYDEQIDEMRGTKTRVASVRAEGYAPMAPELFVAKKEGESSSQLAIRGSLDEATAPQMSCYDYVNMKFDNGPIRKVGCNMGMAVVLDPSVLPALRKSKVTWIEIPTSFGGRNQYKFNTANLKL